jgi:hypothetical protein
MIQIFNIPSTNDQGSATVRIGKTEYYDKTWRGAALAKYNSMRAHDGQPPLKRLPRGTTVLKVRHLPVPPINIDSSSFRKWMKGPVTATDLMRA